MLTLTVPWWEIVVRTAAVYVVVHENLAKEDITEAEVAMAAREHGVEDLADLSAAILEPDGSISIIEKRGERVRRTRRRFRQFKR